MKCCFCGHGRYWEVPNSIVALLLETIEYLINYRNVDTFISGGMGEFDRLCESAIGELKKSYSHIKLFLYICPRNLAARQPATGQSIKRAGSF